MNRPERELVSLMIGNDVPPLYRLPLARFMHLCGYDPGHLAWMRLVIERMFEDGYVRAEIIRRIVDSTYGRHFESERWADRTAVMMLARTSFLRDVLQALDAHRYRQDTWVLNEVYHAVTHSGLSLTTRRVLLSTLARGRRFPVHTNPAELEEMYEALDGNPELIDALFRTEIIT